MVQALSFKELRSLSVEAADKVQAAEGEALLALCMELEVAQRACREWNPKGANTVLTELTEEIGALYYVARQEIKRRRGEF